jgi:hypothetical protein
MSGGMSGQSTEEKQMFPGDRSARESDDSTRIRLVVLLFIVITLLLLLAWYWFRPGEVTSAKVTTEFLRSGPNDRLPEDFLVEEEHYPLPEDGNSLPGRPDVPMPIPEKIYQNVELKIDGKIVESPLRFRAGQHVMVEGVIDGNPELTPYVSFSGGLALVTRADNRRGWHIHHYEFCHSKTSRRKCHFDGEYTFPNEPGEYVLIIPSSAVVGHVDHPILIAAEYDLTLE